MKIRVVQYIGSASYFSHEPKNQSSMRCFRACVVSAENASSEATSHDIQPFIHTLDEFDLTFVLQYGVQYSLRP